MLLDTSPLTSIYFTTLEKTRKVRSPILTQPNFLVFGKYTLYNLQYIHCTIYILYNIYIVQYRSVKLPC